MNAPVANAANEVASTLDQSVILEAIGVSMVFPGTIALDNADFVVRKSAVTALVGENGAGKSTLMKILAGVNSPTSGELRLNGETVVFNSVHDASAKGIGIVFQELNLCPNLSIAENIFLTHPYTKGGVHIDRARQTAHAAALLKRLEHDLSPDTLVGELRIGEQQIVEIAKALSRDVQVLIMDEPTSALSESEVEVLFRVIDELRRSGVAIIYISHRLEELTRIADYVSVLRDGKMQNSARMADVDVPWIIDQMVGKTMMPPQRSEKLAGGIEVLRTENVCLPKVGGGYLVDHVSLSIAAGEIVGIYGLMGAGRTELFECLFGLRPDAIGNIHLNGENLAGLSIAERIRKGLFLVPEDRQRDGLLQNLSVLKNMSISSLWQFRRGIAIQQNRESGRIDEMIKALRVKVSAPDVEVTALSGGNQQKVVIGKSLLTQPKLLLLDEPTRGIDIGAKAEVFKTMRQLAEQGLGVVFATSDLKEIMSAADRILVMSRGLVTGDFPRSEATERKLVAASTMTEADLATNHETARSSEEPLTPITEH
ncbi:MAG: sugar ABC transporter ATP-binding protein [Propionivibrio sp.]|uniref:sugar ABC transporter ATP-binding protein n=1 Tax=Propionivibrio sp. TaxID=2212460 RepID=UPI001B59D650|nr:sugar ABC transporter ATP-binding protein [Propionivibrio sp.]MBP7201762.1 sugar ABC transporter ATP-binding protein [Propionivibrio sp.]